MDGLSGVNRIKAEFNADILGESDFQGSYNAGYRVDGDSLDLEGDIVDNPDEYVLWTPLEPGTPEINNEEDVLAYHVARARNTEVMREEGLNVPEVAFLGGEMGSFLVTPLMSARQSFEGDRRRNNPHRQETRMGDNRRYFHEQIDKAVEDFPAEELVTQGEYVDAGNGFFDDHKDNWGLRGTSLVRFDLGEVPSSRESWSKMPYNGPEEFYEEEGIREYARKVAGELDIDPERELSEEYRELMRE